LKGRRHLASQKIRPSQFVTTYGPGSIIELPNGPHIIPSADTGLFKDRNPADYQIHHKAMEEIILAKEISGTSVPGKIFSLPTNDSEGAKSEEILYRTKPFPEWKLCLNNDTHNSIPGGRNAEILYLGNNRCPICERQPNHNSLSTASPVRFVTICKDGHLDEVSWNYLLHQDKPNHDCTHSQQPNALLQNANVFFWNERGGALSQIQIECPRCDASKSFGNFFYSKNLRCSGRSPENEEINSEPYRPRGCHAETKIMQRQAASIRMPVIKTLLSIQSRASPLHDIMSQELISSLIASVRRRPVCPNGILDNKNAIDELLVEIGYLVEDGKPLSKDLNTLKSEKWETLVSVIRDISQTLPVGYHGLVLDEFDELNKASIHGAPPSPEPTDPLFVVRKTKRRWFTTKHGGHKFAVVPIETLQTVSVQTGFKRDDTGDDPQLSESRLVPSSFEPERAVTENWFPGVRYTGEGIFIRLDEPDVLESILQNNPVADKWNAIHHNEKQSPSLSKFLFRDSENSRDEIHPGFVWWHTFAHLLIRIISDECGYSSASIRERIYFKIDSNNKINGGILLYAAQPGAEGTSGGLISLVEHFDSFINKALEHVSTCSADPLCQDTSVDDQKINGACCYGCLMNSETSCEHRNMWLDRNVLSKSLP
jgi:hypothetical protein